MNINDFIIILYDQVTLTIIQLCGTEATNGVLALYHLQVSPFPNRSPERFGAMTRQHIE